MGLFANKAYEFEHGWNPVGEPEKLTKEEIAAIREIRVKESVLDDGTIIKNVVFFMKEGKPRSIKLSPYCEQFKTGARLRATSIEIQEFEDPDTGDTVINCSGAEL